VSRQGGISEEQIFALPDFRSSDLFSPREKAVLELAEEMTRTPVAVPDELFARLREHFNDDQLIELTTSIAYENFRARNYHALEIGSDDLFVCTLPGKGSQQAQKL
jgi:alkylhydroperoxidase family enzyme